METIIAPIDRSLLKSELTSDNFLRKTNYGNREIYSVTHHDAPNVLREIGRLREISFREAGGGTGKSMDLDDYDLCEVPYRQLIVWDNDEDEIIGGYRYLEGSVTPIANGVPQISTAKMFHFSQKFIQDYLPKTIELGRSFIQPKYQSSRSGLFSLDNLWDGLGALVVKNPDVDYFFGKVTMYPTFNVTARDYLLRFLNLYFCDEEKLVTPIDPVSLITDLNEIDACFKGLSLDEAFKTANREIRELGENIPPLFSAYIKLSSTMKTFGTAINKSFGGVEETGILVKISDIYEEKKARHVAL
ncbi:MAG: GNAT family N-acetyltransferase [Bacteroidales bacterium]|nr:GNAT family N-acetyltransferase [Bacteroidales bacterium]